MSVHAAKIQPPKAIKRKSPPNKSPDKRRTKEKMPKTSQPKKTLSEPLVGNESKTCPCTECGFVFNSETDLACHISMIHASLKPLPEDCDEVKEKQNVEQKQQQHKELQQMQEESNEEVQEEPNEMVQEEPNEVVQEEPNEVVQEEPNEVVQSKPITENEVEEILKEKDDIEVKKTEQNVIEDVIDVEKEQLLITRWKLLTEATNWRKTAQDLDLDLKSAQKSNERLVKEKLGVQEDYTKVAAAAGHLQQRVHTLEEEIKELKIKADLDKDEKERAEIKAEKLMQELDQEGIPKCPVCDKRFPNTEVLQGHIDISHEGHKHPDSNKPIKRNINTEEMENSDQSGYGTTKDYQLVAVQCKKCDETLANNHLLRLHMRQHMRKEQEVLKCTNCDCEYKTTDENSFLNHIVDNHSTLHICQTCNNRFPSKQELVAHIVREHNFKSTNQIAAPVAQQNTNQQLGPNQIKCFDCGTMLPSREDLMKHKKDHHWKQKLCPYYHGVGRGCRFPDRVCFNVHMLEEQRGQGAPRQEARSQEQEQEVRSQGQRVQGAGGQEENRGSGVSWARVAGGPRAWGQEVRQGQAYDARPSIDCRDGTFCSYYSQGNCRYRHLNIRNQPQETKLVIQVSTCRK